MKYPIQGSKVFCLALALVLSFTVVTSAEAAIPSVKESITKEFSSFTEEVTAEEVFPIQETTVEEIVIEEVVVEEVVEEEVVEEVAVKEVTTYDVIYSTSNPIPEIAARVRPAVVEVIVSDENWDPITRIASVDVIGSGSGCYIQASEQGGYILTNYHVVNDGDVFTLLWLDGTEMNCKLVGYDDGTDIAVLSFEEPAPEGVEVIPMGDSDALQIGELAIAIGNPGSGANTLYGTVTAGIISGLDRPSINADNFSRAVSVIQTDAAINTGNSGGALLNAKGELVGIPTLKFMYSYDVVYEGLSFCIPINTVKGLVSQIIETGNVIRPRLGLTVAAVDGPEDPMQTIPPAGVQIYEVEMNGPGHKAGLEPGDIIFEANGLRVYTFLDLTVELDKCEAGDSIELKVYRYPRDIEGNVLGGYEELNLSLVLEMLD